MPAAGGTLFLYCWLSSALVMTGGWLWQYRSHNAGIVDVLWALLVAGSAVFFAAQGPGALLPRSLTGLLGGLWGVRLAWHLWQRVRRGEDSRYQYLRSHWRGSQLKFFGFFQLQAALVPLFALPFWVAARNPASMPLLAGAAVGVWLLSIGGETLADRQLARFVADPGNRGRTCREGLWRYSRHPNYFCEWLHWFSYCLLAVGAPQAWLAWSGPLVMYVFLRWVSGIPFTEAQAVRSRGDDYRDYQRRTSMFFPWPPRPAR